MDQFRELNILTYFQKHRIPHISQRPSHSQCRDRLVLGWLQLGHVLGPVEHLVGHRIIHTIVPVLVVLRGMSWADSVGS